MHRRAFYHAPTGRIYTPSGFAIEVPAPAEDDRKTAELERLLFARLRRNAWGRETGEVAEAAHPLLERYMQQRLAELRVRDAAEVGRKQYAREREERRLGLRGVCVVSTRPRAQILRDEQSDAAWTMREAKRPECECASKAASGRYDPACDVCLAMAVERRAAVMRGAMLRPVGAILGP